MSLHSDLSPSQLEAVKTVQGPVIIVAGAGSGKTRVLTYRIAHLLHVGVPSHQILALTFTNKAAGEMKERIARLVGSPGNAMWVGTFHSMLARFLRIESDKLGFGRNFTIYDEQDSLNAVKGVLNSLGFSHQQFNPQAVRARISNMKNRLVEPEAGAAQTADMIGEVTAKVFARYRQQLKENNAMDFDDLLLLPIRLFDSHKQVLNQYQDRFRFILVDEYQDTNRAQYVVLKQLADKHRNICVVGDDAQSIYAFRGAEIQNILNFQSDYPEAKLFRLEQNYRSTKTILSTADLLIKNNVNQIPKNLWTENQKGEPVTVMECDDDREEGANVASRILEDIHRVKLDFKDFAVLYRTNAQSRTLEDALRKNAIPYTIVGGVEFYQRKEVKDVVAYFRVLVNPSDRESFLRIVNYPNRGLGNRTIQRLQTFAETNKSSLVDATLKALEIPQTSQKAKEKLLWLGNLFHRYRNLAASMSISEISRAMVDEIGILEILKEEGTPDAISRRENVQELLSAISEFASIHSNATLENFLEEVSLVSDIDEWDKTQNAVTLMTLHSAKGLEFPVVFVAGLEEGLLPLYTTTLSGKELEEERRLLYVGITRAMQKLYLSFTRLRFRFGDATYPSPSRFLDEIENGQIHRVFPKRKSWSSRDEFARPVLSNDAHRRSNGQDLSDYFSDPIPDYDHEASGSERLRVGMVVEHEIFGRGTISTLSGRGEGMRAFVEFDSVGRKQLLLKYAKLKII